MSFLFQPLKLRDVVLKNRIVMAPMCMYKAKEGLVNEWHLIHYATRAIGGVGLIIVEATAVDRIGRISRDDLGLWEDEQVEGHRILVSHIHEYDSKAGIQLGHAGRKSNVGYGRVIAPSAIAFNENYLLPEAMTLEEIEQVIQSFKASAKRAEEAGYDVIEIHGAHGYLINEFLSPLTNLRTDAYGGSLENRARFLVEIVKAVRSVWPMTKPLFVRFSAEEYMAGGNTAEDIATICTWLEPLEVDVAHISSGGVVDVGVKAYPGYQIGMADVVRRNTKLHVVGGGLITDAEQANDILSQQAADMIFFGRELLRNPYWALNAAKVLQEDITWPKSYERAK